jgi:uncharacterized protein (DUF2235 family)
MHISLASLVSVAVLSAGCTTANIVYKPALAPAVSQDQPRTIAIFFDGTHNEIATDTNIKKLHSLVTLRDQGNVATLYVEGVGPADDVVGMVTGAGIGERVRIAYRFLLDNYHTNDKIYIFGFSRGAYSARILTSLLYHAGVATSSMGLTHEEIAETVYSALHDANEQKNTNCSGPFARHCKFLYGLSNKIDKPVPVPVELLGLWDTVEALGVKEVATAVSKGSDESINVNVNGANDHYGDQLCNVRRAYHALSLDDDRESVFTPLLLSRRHLLEECDRNQLQDADLIHDWNKQIRRGRLQEVWFSGAHSDVGGGYQESQLSGVSLNWMITQMEKDGIRSQLLSAGTSVRNDIFGSSHDPAAGPWKFLYPRLSRNIIAYVSSEEQLDHYGKKLCVHPSVFDRRSVIPPASNEYIQLALVSGNEKACYGHRASDSHGTRPEQISCPMGEASASINVLKWPCDMESE